MSPPLVGHVDSLPVRRGDQVKGRRAASSLWINSGSGTRYGAGALVLSEAEFARQENFFFFFFSRGRGAWAPDAAQDYDRARSTRDQDRSGVCSRGVNFNQNDRRHTEKTPPLVYDSAFSPRRMGAAGSRWSSVCRRKHQSAGVSFLKRRFGFDHYGDTTG